MMPGNYWSQGMGGTPKWMARGGMGGDPMRSAVAGALRRPGMGQPGPAGPAGPSGGGAGYDPKAWQAGDTSQGYMQRQGMGQPQINSALAMSQRSPGMSYQDVMAGGGGDPSAWQANDTSQSYMQRQGM